MKYTFRQLIENNAKGVLLFDLYLKLFVYPLAIPLSWLLLNFTAVTANQLTLTGLVVGCLGAVLSLFFGLKYLVIGYMTAYVLDFADGTLARNGRGGGSKGVFLDIITDRTVLCVCVVALSAHHMRLEQGAASFCLLLYILSYLYEDVLCYGFRVAKNRAGEEFVEQGVTLPPLTFRNAFLKASFLLPNRLSSPLLIFAVGAVSESPVAAYLTGFAIVVVGYVRGVLGLRDAARTRDLLKFIRRT